MLDCRNALTPSSVKEMAPFPAGLNDCVSGLEWVVANAAQLNIDPDRVIVAGESGGGNLTLATGLKLKADGKLGLIKGLYALAHEPQNAPVCAVALSPPRLSYSWFCSSPEGADFLQTYQLAERHAANDQSGAILEVKLPLPMLITAGGFVEKYGPEERYNYLRFVVGVPCPTLITLGSVEVANNMAFRETPQAVEELAAKRKNLHVETIPDGDHFYNGVREALFAQLDSWLRRTLS